MRLIGHLPNKTSASTFSDYLYVQGITSVVESEKDGWAIWIHSEDELDKARGLLALFLTNPNDPKYQGHSQQATALKERKELEEAKAEKRYFDRSRLFRSSWLLGIGPLTWALIVLSTVVTVLSSFGIGERFLEGLFFSRYFKGMPEILDGQVWRLITPIFLHANLLHSLGVLHLLFNMLWLQDLGSMIERHQGTGRLLILVTVLAALSNFGQYYTSGPLFGGMSGVVYGLLGYIWMKGKFDPASGLFLHPQTVSMMLIWFFLCLFKVIPHIANTAHAVGLGVGVSWGYLASMLASRNR